RAVRPAASTFMSAAAAALASPALSLHDALPISEANALGLTTQVPTREIFLTSGPTRKLRLGNRIVELKHGSRWQLALGKRAAGKDRKSTRLNSSHVKISYAVFCLKKKNRTSRTR